MCAQVADFFRLINCEVSILLIESPEFLERFICTNQYVLMMIKMTSNECEDQLGFTSKIVYLCIKFCKNLHKPSELSDPLLNFLYSHLRIYGYQNL